jgi:putative DNA primase/helicase
MIEQVHSYVNRGWAVFPCKNKIPLTAHGYKDASNDIEQVNRLFAGHQSPNVAIATGKVSGIFVLDIDVKNGAGGDDSLKELEREHGELPHTIEAITWSGGRHIFFKYPERGIGCKTGIRPGIDIRGDGGYVIAPPSVIEGRSYAWEVSHLPEETMIADAPEWLLDLLEEKQPAVDLSDKEAKISKNRNEALMHMGVKLRKMGFDHQQIEDSLQTINTNRCSPPLPKKEVSHIAKSVARYEIDAKKLSEPLTDVWNASLFIEKYGDEIRFCDSLGGWYIWDGSRWKRDDTFQILRLAKNTVKQIYEMARANGDKLLFKHAVKSESETKLRAMINLAKSEGVAVQSEQFDTDVFLLNCKNGTLDLRNGELKNHSRNDYITRRVELDYKADAQCPEWRKFMASIFLNDQEIIGFMQRAVGYALSGSMKEQCVFILFGVGMNGKSTFLKHVYRILGDYAMNTPATTLMEKYGDSIPNDVARLKGARLVTAVESGKNKALAESQIKQLTGDDPISARFLHREYFDFFATFKIFFATNHKPNISGTDKGIWRRIMTIPFEKIISPEERDPLLDEKLSKEYEGILTWAVEGFQMWQKDGLGDVAKITEATNEYREESDLIGNFIEERCLTGSEYKVSATAILKTIQQWAKDNGLRSVRRNEFIDYMKKRGFTKDRLSSSGDKGKIYWFGIGLKDDETSEESEASFGGGSAGYDGEFADKRPF